jgi:hypothetical protein
MKRSTKLILFSVMTLAVILPMSTIQADAVQPQYWWDQYTLSWNPTPMLFIGTHDHSDWECCSDTNGRVYQLHTSSSRPLSIAMNVRLKLMMKAGSENSIDIAIYSDDGYPATPSDRLELSTTVTLSENWYYYYFYIGADCINRYVTFVIDMDEGQQFNFYYTHPVLQILLDNSVPD